MTSTELKEMKAFVLAQDPIFLPLSGIVGGRQSYVCPRCGNGSGESCTGILHDPTSAKRGKNTFKCFACGMNEDIVGLYDEARLSTKTDKFRDKLRDLSDYYMGHASLKREVVVPKKKVVTKTISKTMMSETRTSKLSAYFEACKARREPSLLETVLISESTQAHFEVGFDPAWVHPDAEEYYRSNGDGEEAVHRSQRIIIPTSDSSYLALDAHDVLSPSAFLRVGPPSLFYESKTQYAERIVVTFTVIEAMRLYEANNAHTLAIGGPAYLTKLLRMISNGEFPNLVEVDLVAIDSPILRQLLPYFTGECARCDIKVTTSATSM